MFLNDLLKKDGAEVPLAGIREDRDDRFPLPQFAGQLQRDRDVRAAGDAAEDALKDNLWTYSRLVEAVEQHWKGHDVLYGFLPDHGCHQIDKGAGSHGLDMEEDLNIVHLYKAYPAKEC